MFCLKNGGDLGVIIDSDNQPWVYWSGTAIAKNGTVSLGNWHHLVLTCTGNDLKLYLDGLPCRQFAGGGLVAERLQEFHPWPHERDACSRAGRSEAGVL